MTLRMDHAVIVVSDLAAASRNFASLGFTVVQGGIHQYGLTHNALIFLRDGSFVELVAIRQRAVAPILKLLNRIGVPSLILGRRFAWVRRFAFGTFGREGLTDFALLSSALAEDLNAAQGRGLTFASPLSFSRVWPDGQRVSWQVVAPLTRDLPFLRTDWTPRVLIDEAAVEHPNGAIAIADITIVVKDLQSSAARYQALLNIDAQPTTSLPISDSITSTFHLGSSTLTLVEPVGGRQMRDYLAKCGEGPYALGLRTAIQMQAQVLDRTLTNGVIVELRSEAKAGT